MKTVFLTKSGRGQETVNVDASADVVFVVGGLKAAQNTLNAVRANVISDVSKALDCAPEALDFLFESRAGHDLDTSVFDFPDSERRRTVIRNNVIDAAE